MPMQIENAVVSLNSGQFRYRQAGSPAQPALVLLHALTLDATSWDAVTLALSDRFHVLALDQRGHGQSARTTNYSFEAMRDDAIEFVDALGIDRVNLIGHSMGGTVAYLVAQSNPSRVATLITEDTPPPWSGVSIPEPAEKPPSAVPFDWAVLAPIIRQLNAPDAAWWTQVVTSCSVSRYRGGACLKPLIVRQWCVIRPGRSSA